MGKIKQGILGGFNGTVGTVVGASWKGISYMRGKAQSIRNPRTPAQKGQRKKFAITMAFLQRIKPFIDIGYKGQANKKSPFNAAMSFILRNGITGTAPDFALDYANILVSQGSLDGAADANAVAGSSKVTFNWIDDSASGNDSPDDIAMILLYNPSKEQAYVDVAAATRDEETLEVSTPRSWTGDSVHPYIAFVAEDGSSVSDSVHLAAVTIA